MIKKKKKGKQKIEEICGQIVLLIDLNPSVAHKNFNIEQLISKLEEEYDRSDVFVERESELLSTTSGCSFDIKKNVVRLLEHKGGKPLLEFQILYLNVPLELLGSLVQFLQEFQIRITEQSTDR